ncbi:hypothetical protein [Candidatus Vidania fulgoroideorum]
MINICMVGYGNLGISFFKKFYKKNIYKNLKISFLILNSKILKKKRKIEKLLKQKIYIFKKYRKLLLSKSINIFVELTNNFETSKKIIFLALKKNKFVITANKNVISIFFKKIYKYINKQLFIEASVFGGVPIINNIIHHYKFSNIKEITGILNGTTNYILDNIFRKKKNFNISLKKAIKNGFSEKKPIFDLIGLDTFYKIYILLKIINNKIIIKKKNILGIYKTKDFFYNFIKKENHKIKLIGKIIFKKKFFSIDVFPCILKKKFILKKEYNIINIKTKNGNFLIKGKGAGGKCTSISLLNNIFNLNKSNFIKKCKKIEELDFYKKKIIIIIYKKKKFFYKLYKKSIKVIKKKKINNKRFFYLKKKMNVFCCNKFYIKL